MPSTHDLKQDETILKLSRRVANLVRKISDLSRRIAKLEESIVPRTVPGGKPRKSRSNGSKPK